MAVGLSTRPQPRGKKSVGRGVPGPCDLESLETYRPGRFLFCMGEIPARKIVKREDLKNALTAMLDAKGPYLLEIKVEKQENVFPMIAPGAGVGEIRLE